MASRPDDLFSDDSDYCGEVQNDGLFLENQELWAKLATMEKELGQVRLRLSASEERVRVLEAEKKEKKKEEEIRIPWRTPSPEEERVSREPVSKGKRGGDVLGDLVAQVVEGGKRRKVGGAVDPEIGRGNCFPMMVKVGGVLWEDGIGGVVLALHDTGVDVCEGARWLVDEEERKKRRDRGGLSSTVVVKIRGEESLERLSRSGLWVGGRWCSVKRFVAVPPRKRVAGWEKVVGRLRVEVKEIGEAILGRDVGRKAERKKDLEMKERMLKTLEGVSDRLEKVEGVKEEEGREEKKRMKQEEFLRAFVGPELGNKGKGKEVEVDDEFEEEAEAFFGGGRAFGRGLDPGSDWEERKARAEEKRFAGLDFGKPMGVGSLAGRGSGSKYGKKFAGQDFRWK